MKKRFKKVPDHSVDPEKILPEYDLTQSTPNEALRALAGIIHKHQPRLPESRRH